MKQQQRRGGVDHQSDASSDRVGALERIRNAYAKKIEELVEDCASNYLALLRAAHISERAQNTKEIFEINVHSTNLVYKGEDLLKLIAELKHDFVLNDLKSIAQEAEEEQKKMIEMRKKTDKEISRLKREVHLGLEELEASYYSSPYR